MSMKEKKERKVRKAPVRKLRMMPLTYIPMTEPTRYVVYVFDGFVDDKRFEFNEYEEAFSCFKRFVRANKQTGLFHYKTVKTTHRDKQNRYTYQFHREVNLIQQTDDFPMKYDRQDVTTHRAMGTPGEAR